MPSNTTLTEDEIIELINSMEITESSASGGELEYVLVKDTPENREKLAKIVPDLDEYIKNIGKQDPDDEDIEISVAAFMYGRAHVYSKGKFIKYTEDEMIEIIVNQEMKLRNVVSRVKDYTDRMQKEFSVDNLLA
ncbi:hypothetical protein SP15_197 [Bacillus phage SP-15]|uniref:Uncharacterized protein n=1 Tax=Bacillus phage SP-15 TaxID=1792032 RepID=A0A127AWN4_9CAUD|nr:hypothetical protein SP15_197 [Bacillus phage SP-15]AMM44997.1 hypothetical protein SP15_197 [Bacillus phage SP-15]